MNFHQIYNLLEVNILKCVRIHYWSPYISGICLHIWYTAYFRHGHRRLLGLNSEPANV